jgi:hypothetical protein
MNKSMGLGDINNRVDNISERGSWYKFIALAVIFIAVGIVETTLNWIFWRDGNIGD